MSASSDKAADVVRAHELLMGEPSYVRDELRDIIRRVITGLSPEAADAAIVAFFGDGPPPRRHTPHELANYRPRPPA
jgi:hypothetical protein